MKKLLSALLAAAMVFSLCAINVFAASPAKFTASSVTGQRGDTVEITIDLSDVTAPGLTGYEATINFDKNNLEAVNAVKTAAAFPNNFFQKGNVTTANNTGTWKFPCAGSDPEIYNGTLFTATFKIKDNAPFGDYAITLTCKAYDENGSTITTGVVIVNGKITVACSNHKTEGVDWTVTDEPECEVPGEKVKYCSVCGDIAETEAIDPLGHDWGAWTETTPAGCETPGEEKRVCNRDANHFETRPIDPTDHDWSEWTITTDPSLTVPGEATRTCNKDAAHVDTMDLPVGTLKLTDAITGATLELKDPTEDSMFYGDTIFTALNWADVIELLAGEGSLDLNAVKTELAKWDADVKAKAGSAVFDKYLVSINNPYFDEVGSGDADDAKFILTIPMNDNFKNAENMKAYIAKEENSATTFEEVTFEVTDDGIVVDITDFLTIDPETNAVVATYIAFTGNLPSPGTGVEFYVGFAAIVAVAAAAAFVFARKRA